MVADQNATLGRKNKSTAAILVSPPGKAVAKAFHNKNTPQNATEEKTKIPPERLGPITTNTMPVMMWTMLVPFNASRDDIP